MPSWVLSLFAPEHIRPGRGKGTGSSFFQLSMVAKWVVSVSQILDLGFGIESK